MGSCRKCMRIIAVRLTSRKFSDEYFYFSIFSNNLLRKNSNLKEAVRSSEGKSKFCKKKIVEEISRTKRRAL